jgi:hypothetical protein
MGSAISALSLEDLSAVDMGKYLITLGQNAGHNFEEYMQSFSAANIDRWCSFGQSSQFLWCRLSNFIH